MVVLLAACSSERSATSSTASSSTTLAPVTAATTAPGTVPDSVPDSGPDTTDAPVTTIEATTTTSCATVGDTARKESTDPLAMSSLVGVDIRTGAHECYERIVIEFGGVGDVPGWWVEYVDDPVRLGESDEFVDIAGAATLQVRTGAWMPDMEGTGYDGPTQVFPTNVTHVLELRQTENWEGISIWSIGLDARLPFTVDVLAEPVRLVIDVQIG